MAIADDLMQGAQQTIQNQQHSASDALQAYHIAQSAENARKELDMEKDNHDMQRANFLINSVHTISTMPEAAQGMALQSLAKQVPQIIPGGDPSFIQALAKDRESRQNAFVTFANYLNPDQPLTPDNARSILSSTGGDVNAAIQGVQARAQMVMQMKGNQARAAGMTDRADVMKQGQANQFAHQMDNDSIIKLSTNNLNSLTRSNSILNKPADQPITAKDLNLAYNDYINAVAAGGAATEGKINRELPVTFEQQYNEWKQKFGDNADLRKDPSGQALINLLQKNIGTVTGDIKGAVSDRANDYYSSASNSPNPYVQKMGVAKLQHYDIANKYGAVHGGMPQQAGAPAAPAAGEQPAAVPSFDDFMKSRGQ